MTAHNTIFYISPHTRTGARRYRAYMKNGVMCCHGVIEAAAPRPGRPDAGFLPLAEAVPLLPWAIATRGGMA